MLEELKYWFSKCSDCLLHPEYKKLLQDLYTYNLTQELIDFLCDKATSKKHCYEIRFEHLKVLLLNKSAMNYDLKAFYSDSLKRCRKMRLKIFFIRGYTAYATEEELCPVMKKFQEQSTNNHDYIDYEHILSVAGLPYLVNTYGYDCFKTALRTVQNEYQKIHPLLRGYFTLNESLEQINLLSIQEMKKRTDAFIRIKEGSDSC